MHRLWGFGRLSVLGTGMREGRLGRLWNADTVLVINLSKRFEDRKVSLRRKS